MTFVNPIRRPGPWATAFAASTVLACADGPAGPEPAATWTPAASLVPCSVAGMSRAWCGRIDVAEDPGTAGGRRLSLRVVVRRADRVGEPDPVVFFDGGPGSSVVANAANFASLLPGVAGERDLVFVEQRGTGDSNGLQCGPPLPSGEASLFGSLFPADHLDICARRLSERADLSSTRRIAPRTTSRACSTSWATGR